MHIPTCESSELDILSFDEALKTPAAGETTMPTSGCMFPIITPITVTFSALGAVTRLSASA